ncbi:MAG: diacylglycerol kinase family lipid kinase [bacterium]|nr:MAG: diacylglycerol kinase family lipid kinase [bacterium]
MGSGKHIKFIYNPRSGLIHREQLIRKVIANYFPSNLCYYDFHITQGKWHAYEIAREAVKYGYDIVVAIGGDGTVNETASGLVNSTTMLAIIPNGSGNGLARGLGIPISIRRAAKLITTGKTRSIDVGQIDNRFFFVIAGLGLDAMIGKRFEKGKLRGPAPYYIAGFKEFFRYHEPEYEIKFDGQTIRKRALVVAIANMKQYGNNAIIAPHAKPDDGFLDIAIIEPTSFVSAIYYLPTLFTGRIDRAPFIRIYRATKFEIHREFPAPYTLDGEVFEGKTHLTITMLPKALKVIVNDIHF